jgi:undecaprenyl-phosphate 4-deoxy-4-formamido-L-arabinose transferase
VSIDVLLTWGTTRFTAQSVKHEERKIGVSNYTFRKLLTHAMNMITGFSVLPLQMASFVGFFFAMFGVGLFCKVVIGYLLHGTPVPGWHFLASTISIFSGAQLFTLGIMGEYLARMHFRIMDKPSYSVREITK